MHWEARPYRRSTLMLAAASSGAACEGQGLAKRSLRRHWHSSIHVGRDAAVLVVDRLDASDLWAPYRDTAACSGGHSFALLCSACHADKALDLTASLPNSTTVTIASFKRPTWWSKRARRYAWRPLPGRPCGALQGEGQAARRGARPEPPSQPTLCHPLD